MSWQPNYAAEGRIYGKHIVKTKPDAKIAILYQNDDYGKDYLHGFKEGLGAAVKQIVSEQTYEVTDPTVDSQIVAAKSSGADTFFNITTPKFAAMAIRKSHDIGWRPVHYLNNVSTSVGAVLEPAGLEKAKDIISTQYMMDPTDPRFANDPVMVEYKAFLAKYYPDANVSDANNVIGYGIAQTTVHVLKQCGDDLTRANVMKQAASLKDYTPKGVLPGIKLNTSPDDYAPMESMQMVRFDGKMWVPFGDIAE
ncbi:MAG: ABC transporter substrate-binding protein [Burkholderiaceae bacterium]